MKATTRNRIQSGAPPGGASVKRLLKSALLAFALACAATISAQTTITTTNFSVGTTIPDGSASGLVSAKTVSTPVVSITGLKVALNVSGTYNGDLYCYLVHGSGRSVLLNRTGRRSGS